LGALRSAKDRGANDAQFLKWEVRTVRRLVSLFFATALIAIMAGTASAQPNRSATLWACTTSTGVQLTVDWAGYHPDTLRTVEWSTGSSSPTTTFSTVRSVDWKFGTASYDETFAAWAAQGVTVAADSAFAVDLYAHNRMVAETNSVLFGDLPAC
jgi:hypothetical protein